MHMDRQNMDLFFIFAYSILIWAQAISVGSSSLAKRSESALSSSTCSRLYVTQSGDHECSQVRRQLTHLSHARFLSLNPHLNCTHPLREGLQICLAPCAKYESTPSSSTYSKPSPNGAPHTRRRILVDYIGAMMWSTRLQDVPIRSDIDQSLILSFAIDANSAGIPQNGNFSPFWDPSITPHDVLQVKSSHPNVIVLMSLGGYSLYIKSTNETKTVDWYDPIDPKAWLENAVKSISFLVKKFHLDGIDIDYETFPKSRNFSLLIGTLIHTLKKSKIITIATMAPYDDVIPHYLKLYRAYPNLFDYINYQFYSNDFKNVSSYVEGYHHVSTMFPKKKLLVSLEVDEAVVYDKPPADVFFEAFKELEKSGEDIPGIFLWSADDSKKMGFLVEKTAQCIL